MRTPEEIKKAAACCFGFESCNGCPYTQKRCKDITTSPELIDDMIALIDRQEETIQLMQIQVMGDCGVCKHKKEPEVCKECMSIAYHPDWEYEGLPDIPKGYVLPKKGES